VFLENSRYFDVPQGRAAARDGDAVTVVRLRRLPIVEGRPHQVKAHDRLDILAQRRYGDPTHFWHIADANTELQARQLVDEPGRTIEIPEQ